MSALVIVPFVAALFQTTAGDEPGYGIEAYDIGWGRCRYGYNDVVGIPADDLVHWWSSIEDKSHRLYVFVRRDRDMRCGRQAERLMRRIGFSRISIERPRASHPKSSRAAGGASF